MTDVGCLIENVKLYLENIDCLGLTADGLKYITFKEETSLNCDKIFLFSKINLV